MSSESVLSHSLPSYPVQVRLLLTDESMQIESSILRYWKVFANYESMNSGRVEEFAMPAEVDTLDKLAMLVDFTIKHDEIKITHIKSALHTCVNLLKEPYNVPEWAFKYALEKDLADLFEMAKLAEAIQFAAMSELCSVVLALMFVSFTLPERLALCGRTAEFSEAERDDLKQKHCDWANNDFDYSITY